jgi:curved DNA-binding protein CbpA
MRLTKDLYAILGVPNSAGAREIRTAYRRLAVTLHPDRAGMASTGAFQEAAAAYEVLSDPERRAKYDAQIVRDRVITPAPRASTSGREVIARLSGPLRSLLAAGLLRTIGEDAYELWLSADEAAHGGFFSFSTSAPNQLKHWITIPPGITDGTVLPSLVKAGEMRSELRFHVRVGS